MSLGILKLGYIGNMSFGILKKSEVSLGILKLGEVSLGIFFFQIETNLESILIALDIKSFITKKSKRSLTNIVNSGDVDSWHFFYAHHQNQQKSFSSIISCFHFFLAP